MIMSTNFTAQSLKYWSPHKYFFREGIRYCTFIWASLSFVRPTFQHFSDGRHSLHVHSAQLLKHPQPSIRHCSQKFNGGYTPWKINSDNARPVLIIVNTLDHRCSLVILNMISTAIFGCVAVSQYIWPDVLEACAWYVSILVQWRPKIFSQGPIR